MLRVCQVLKKIIRADKNEFDWLRNRYEFNRFILNFIFSIIILLNLEKILIN